MQRKTFSRRKFIQSSAASVLGVGSSMLLPLIGKGISLSRTNWELGCFNRPWSKWGMEEAIKGASQAIYQRIGLLTRTKTDPLNAADATPEYLAQLKQKISLFGVVPVVASLRTRHDLTLSESIKDLQKQIDNAKFLSTESVLTFGVDRPEHYEAYYQMMAESARYASEKKMKLVLKPHGGGSGAADEILRCLKKVNHPNFKVWYDAGNIIHYTGKDPLAELEPIAEHVTGFCAKDCARQKGEVMIQLGTGKVDFAKIFARLERPGFSFPIMLEGCAVGATPEETTRNARANKEFLGKILMGENTSEAQKAK